MMKENISEAGTCCTYFAERNLPQCHSLVLFFAAVMYSRIWANSSLPPTPCLGRILVYGRISYIAHRTGHHATVHYSRLDEAVCSHPLEAKVQQFTIL